MLRETLKECQLGKKGLSGSQGRLHILDCATCPLHSSCSCVVLLPNLMTVRPGMEKGETGRTAALGMNTALRHKKFIYLTVIKTLHF